MSVTAHRVSEFKFEHSSFDLWHSEKLAQFLEEEVKLSSSLNSYGNGLIEVSVETLERVIRMAEELDLDEDTIAGLRQDIAAAESEGRELVTYYCC